MHLYSGPRRLDTKEMKNFPKPEQIREEISTWVDRDDKHRSGGLLANLEDLMGRDLGEAPEEEGEEEQYEELKQTLGEELFAAVVKKEILKKRPSKSKGKGKQEPRKCYECGSEDHLVVDCPQKRRRRR